MFCIYCGATLPEGAKKCTLCGNPVVRTPEATAQPVSVMMIAAGIRMLFVWGTCGAGALGIAGLLFIMQAKDSGGFRLSRILSFLDPRSDPTGDGWQVIQSFYAIGSGGFFGVGLR